MNRKIQQFVFANKKVVLPVTVLILLGLPFVVTNSYFLHICIMVCIYICLALSLNLVTGYAGQLVLGHAAFYGIGAYTGALLMLNMHINFLAALVISAFITGLFGFLLGMV